MILEPILQPKLSRWKKCLFFVCGLSDSISEEKRNLEEQKQHLKDFTSLQQDPRAKKVFFVNLITLVLAAILSMIYLRIPDVGPTKPTIEIPNRMFIYNGTRPFI